MSHEDILKYLDKLLPFVEHLFDFAEHIFRDILSWPVVVLVCFIIIRTPIIDFLKKVTALIERIQEVKIMNLELRTQLDTSDQEIKNALELLNGLPQLLTEDIEKITRDLE